MKAKTIAIAAIAVLALLMGSRGLRADKGGQDKIEIYHWDPEAGVYQHSFVTGPSAFSHCWNHPLDYFPNPQPVIDVGCPIANSQPPAN